MSSKPITKIETGQRYTETIYGDGSDETMTMIAVRPSTLDESYLHVTYRHADGSESRMICSAKTHVFPVSTNSHGNTVAQEGCDRCFCGCKYWEHDRCIDCGTHVTEVRQADGN